MSAEKRSVHTDALHTLGSIIGEGEKRDAIHIAVEPCIAAHKLHAGEHVGRTAGGKFSCCTKPLGIVDPFLKTPVQPGERFWLLIYPREITSLRHVWAHPEFPDAEVASFAEESGENFENHADDIVAVASKEDSEAWLRKFCAENDCPEYEFVMKVIENGSAEMGDWGRGSLEGEYIQLFDIDGHAAIPPEFWDHVEIVTGRKFASEDRASYFSCSC